MCCKSDEILSNTIIRDLLQFILWPNTTQNWSMIWSMFRTFCRVASPNITTSFTKSMLTYKGLTYAWKETFFQNPRFTASEMRANSIARHIKNQWWYWIPLSEPFRCGKCINRRPLYLIAMDTVEIHPRIRWLNWSDMFKDWSVPQINFQLILSYVFTMSCFIAKHGFPLESLLSLEIIEWKFSSTT